jgi:hypothetical protein
MSTPEEEARERIDPLLDAAGWRVQDNNELSLGAALGVAVREFPLTTGLAIICSLCSAVQLRRAGRLQQAVLKRAFVGRLVPQDPADEPARVLLERTQARWRTSQGQHRDKGPSPQRANHDHPKCRGAVRAPTLMRFPTAVFLCGRSRPTSSFSTANRPAPSPGLRGCGYSTCGPTPTLR